MEKYKNNVSYNAKNKKKGMYQMKIRNAVSGGDSGFPVYRLFAAAGTGSNGRRK